MKSLLSPQDLSLSTLANFPREEDWIDSKIHITQAMHGGQHN